jgi:hypothetical protein
MANENGNITIYNLLNSEGDLWKSAAVAAMKAAVDVINESVNTPHHNERMQWAHNILNNPDQWVKENKWSILA